MISARSASEGGRGMRRKRRIKSEAGSDGEHDNENGTPPPSGAPQKGNSVAFYRQLLRRVKRQVQHIKQEEHALAVYAAEGWRGGSRKKVQLTYDMHRSRVALERRRAAIREALALCDAPPGLRSIPAELFDEEGELEEHHIFCAVCYSYEMADDDDVILCDGPCNCAFHQNCLDPPVDVSKLPEDEGWLCPACDCKADILDVLYEEFGIEYDINEPWTNILPPSANPLDEGPGPGGEMDTEGGGVSEDEEGSGGGGGGGGKQRRRPRRRVKPPPPGVVPATGGWLAEDLPSEDEEDEDFAAEPCEANSDGEPGDRYGGVDEVKSAADAAAHAAEGGGEHDSDGEEGEEGDGEGENEEDGSSEGDDVDSDDLMEDLEAESGLSGLGEGEDEDELGSDGDEEEGLGEEDGEGEGAEMMMEGKRQRKQVNYAELHKQLFGVAPAAPGEDELEEDDDYNPELFSPPGKR
ncbi:hypothetical protein Vretimale_14607 [Volvox reticuliferus]|uniref:PHD-type domain-containing protein n=1 Tax=Volvox reticuliferus TaxID=1737510 RepID=A0A8J4GPX2_9CHLO|nr:hypothetical protein Vretifemale_13123 [Volvox reticuliferus]GIM11027.1 hypothetical protein Vretimale_14607 [Volvox reticuliferus]